MDLLKVTAVLAAVLLGAMISCEAIARGGHGGGGHGGGGHASCNHGSHSHGSHLGFFPYGYGYAPAASYPRTYQPSCAEFPGLPECVNEQNPVVPRQDGNASG